MYFGYTIPELTIFTAATAIIIWSFWKILSKKRHSSSFFYWFLIGVTLFSLWAWRSGNAMYFYQKMKALTTKPYVDPDSL